VIEVVSPGDRARLSGRAEPVIRVLVYDGEICASDQNCVTQTVAVEIAKQDINSLSLDRAGSKRRLCRRVNSAREQKRGSDTDGSVRAGGSDFGG
jgi:Flp pilus assembly protein CpaB